MTPPIFLRNQMTPFVILFVERAGSTYLTSLLDSHPDAVCLREEFAVIKEKGGTAADQLEWADKFLTPALIGRVKAKGFKTKLMDILDPAGFGQLLTKLGCRVIQLQRRNTVKAVVSTINAKRLHDKVGTWNLLKETDRLPAFEIELADFKARIAEREAWDHEIEAFTATLQIPVKQLYYEDLLNDEQFFLNQIFEFINVTPKPVQGKTFKNTKDNLKEVILNFEELKAHYQDTPYASMFDEVLV